MHSVGNMAIKKGFAKKAVRWLNKVNREIKTITINTVTSEPGYVHVTMYSTPVKMLPDTRRRYNHNLTTAMGENWYTLRKEVYDKSENRIG